MKKILVYLFIFLLTSNFISVVSAEQPNLMPSIPGLGEINENTGLPSSFEKFKSLSDNLSETEKSKTYLYQEWTKLFAKNDKFAAVFFYTDMFFSTFDPIWENIFGIKFSWSWEFIFCLTIWIMLIILLYMPVSQVISLNPFLTAVASVIIASLVGKSGEIKRAADTMTFAVKNIWLAVVCLIIAIMIIVIYVAIFKKLGKESEEDEIKKAKESIKLHGKISSEALKKGYSGDTGI
ncbi:hypothetical protein J4218_04800 [Candidatus Pacearchaeota archaeon]|nr:hypothetical protein [Candidatus Pacearchaeota archaeon]